ncbi:MAG: hypothetical protein CMJ31_08260 [Phycisphaerae bacterium]|nr:hypothetical protein [Phycisphaerae bacterium]
MAIGGIDIGGTKIGVCLGDTDGSVLAGETIATADHPDPAALLGVCLERLDALRGKHDVSIESIGVAVPGPYDRMERRFLDPPNMPAWHGFGIGAWLDERAPAACRVMNDANAAAYAEWLWGHERGAHTLVFLTMSTGLGAGIVIEGRVLEGERGLGGEIGRVRLSEDGPVGFGAYGTAEAWASGSGIRQMAETEALRCMQAGEATALHDVDVLDARAVCEAASRGDRAALRVVAQSAVRLGQLIGLLANVLEPQAVVLGTIGVAFPDLFVGPAFEEAKRHAVSATMERLRVSASSLEHRWERQALAAGLYGREVRA